MKYNTPKVPWLSGYAFDSQFKGRWFEPHQGLVPLYPWIRFFDLTRNCRFGHVGSAPKFQYTAATLRTTGLGSLLIMTCR